MMSRCKERKMMTQVLKSQKQIRVLKLVDKSNKDKENSSLSF